MQTTLTAHEILTMGEGISIGVTSTALKKICNTFQAKEDQIQQQKSIIRDLDQQLINALADAKYYENELIEVKKRLATKIYTKIQLGE